MASTKKVTSKKVAPAKSASTRSRAATPKSMPREGKNPKGGLTAKGREYFKQTEGSNLKPGVTGAADTPEKMKRKGSFLRRHFTHPRGPMQDEQGRPTRLALSAHAWGEPVPKDIAAAKKLAVKGHALLEKYHASQEKAGTKKAPSPPAAKSGSAKKSLKPDASKHPPKKPAAPAKRAVSVKRKSARKAAVR